MYLGELRGGKKWKIQTKSTGEKRKSAGSDGGRLKRGDQKDVGGGFKEIYALLQNCVIRRTKTGGGPRMLWVIYLGKGDADISKIL